MPCTQGSELCSQPWAMGRNSVGVEDCSNRVHDIRVEGPSLANLSLLIQNDAVRSIAVRTFRLPGWLKTLQQKRD